MRKKRKTKTDAEKLIKLLLKHAICLFQKDLFK